jgi:hypothetical protein
VLAPLLVCTSALAAAPIVKPCTDAEAKEPRALVKALDAAVQSRDLATAQLAWQALKEHRCLQLATLESPRLPEFDDPEAAQWWWNRGGSGWLHAALDRDGDATVVPPDWPPMLRAELEGARHPAARLLCKAADPGCGRETKGWVLRATEALEMPSRRAQEPPEPTEEARAAKCAAASKKGKDPVARYREWRDCLELERPKTAMLPLARFLAPRDGWFVIRGRRGHYSFCDEVRAYDLATGAAHVAQSCSALALEPGGGVNHDRTDAARAGQRTAGRLPVEALREAAWMAMFADAVQDKVQTWVWAPTRPPGLEPVWRDDGRLSHQGLGLSGWFSSAQTQLAWSWQGPEGLRASGSITWPNSSSAGQMHAVRLLRIAEVALVEGCPPAPLPKQLVVGGRPGVSRLDASPESISRAEARLIEVLTQPNPECGSSRRPP